MARDRFASDITPGSTWHETSGPGSARVVTRTAGYVCYEDQVDGAIRTMHHLRFRERYAEPYDARQVRSQFSMSLANLDQFHAFWSPSERRMYARSATASPDELRTASRGRPALPADAELVGTYTAGAIAAPRWHQKGLRGLEAFFDDLHELLHRIRRRAAAAL